MTEERTGGETGGQGEICRAVSVVGRQRGVDEEEDAAVVAVAVAIGRGPAVEVGRGTLATKWQKEDGCRFSCRDPPRR